jgi:thioredoxin-related protein
LFAIQFYTDILSENYNDALKKSKELNKPILLIFVTNWCTYCNKMKLDTFSNEKVVKEIEEKYISVYVDADKEKDLVKKFSVTVLPSCVITNYKEEKLKVSVGFKKPEEFLKFIK